MSNGIWVFIAIVALAVFAAKAHALNQADNLPHPGYAEGQEWEYRTRPGEEASTLIILKIEDVDGLGTAYHVSVENVKIANPHTETGIQTRMFHVPLDKTALDASVTALKDEQVTIPDYEEGYQAWADQNGGLFNAPVADILTMVEKTVSPQ